jgi:hypothetical protein
MSELSTEVKKVASELETKVKSWWASFEPIAKAELASLEASFETTIGPDLLTAAEDAAPVIAEALGGIISPTAAIEELEALGKTVADTAYSVAKALALKGLSATGTQLFGAVVAEAAKIAASTAAPAAPLSNTAESGSEVPVT